MVRDFLFKDIWLKLASMVAALFIWLTVHAAILKESEQANNPQPGLATRVFRDVPVEVVSSGKDALGFKANPSRVSVGIRGEAEMMDRLRIGEIHARVVVTGAETGNNIWRHVEISAPTGVTPYHIEPPDVEIIVPRK